MSTDNNKTKENIQPISIHQAMLTIQRGMGKIGKEGQANAGKGFKYDYATLDSVLEALEPLLEQTQTDIKHDVIKSEDGEFTLFTYLVNYSGETIHTEMPLAGWQQTLRGNNPAQQMGSANSYYRRYSLFNLFSIRVGDLDDDAQSMPESPKFKKTNNVTQHQSGMKTGDKYLFNEGEIPPISEKQIKFIKALIRQNEKAHRTTKEKILAKYVALNTIDKMNIKEGKHWIEFLQGTLPEKK